MSQANSYTLRNMAIEKIAKGKKAVEASETTPSN